MKITGLMVRQPSSGLWETSSFYLPGIYCPYFCCWGRFLCLQAWKQRSTIAQHLKLTLAIKVTKVRTGIWAYQSVHSCSLTRWLVWRWAHEQSGSISQSWDFCWKVPGSFHWEFLGSRVQVWSYLATEPTEKKVEWRAGERLSPNTFKGGARYSHA